MIFKELVLLALMTLTALGSAEPVVFDAVRETSQSVSSSHAAILYDTVTMNIGGAYNPRTGIFTAPLNGIYEFSWAIRTTEGSGAYAHLRVNGEAQGQLFTGSNGWGSSSSFRMLSLDQGDEVFVELFYRSDVSKTISCNGWKACVFMGRLLYSKPESGLCDV